MKSLYWNVRGLANPSSKLALKNLVLESKPDVCFVAEPWMNVNSLSQRWLNRMSLKLFAVNTRPNLLPNLWCLCNYNLNPTLLSADDQQISISVDLEGKTFGITAVYASNCYIKRRSLWNTISQIQTQHTFPWSCIGDFNTILGAHEYRGNCIPARIPMEDFQMWSDSHNLIHLPTHGSFFTWSNGRRGRNHTQKRLDRVVCNQDWIDSCSLSMSLLSPKVRLTIFLSF
jgi:hypothetical protein